MTLLWAPVDGVPMIRILSRLKRSEFCHSFYGSAYGHVSKSDSDRDSDASDSCHCLIHAAPIRPVFKASTINAHFYFESQ